MLRLNAAEKVDWLEVRWPQPSAHTGRFIDLPIDRYLTIVEGRGVVPRVRDP